MIQKFKQACISRKCGKAEIIAFFCYIIGISIIGYYHEPWFDEAQAWMIARCATIKEIMFEIPHYEGHPPLWHLLLVPFAKLGAPYEISLFLVNAVFCIISVALLLWKSPFPKIIRCLLPFSYFYFYQFGVMSRPYSMMMLALTFAAMAYSMRNQKPVRYILSLCFLCLTSAYGMVLACGMCLVWTAEIYKTYQSTKTWKNALSDKRAYLLLAILIFAILMLSCMIPAKDVYYDEHTATIFQRLKNTIRILILPFDSLFGCYISLQGGGKTTGGLIAECVGSVILYAIFLPFLHANHKKALCILPYTMYGIIGLYTFFAVHHEGIGVLYIMFVFWVIFAEGVKIPLFYRSLFQKIQSVVLRKAVIFTGIMVCVVPFYFTVTSSVNDILHPYGMKEIVNFIRENHLENRKLMTDWTVEYVEQEGISGIVFDETLPSELPEILSQEPEINGIPTAVLPYFEKNIFMNYNTDDPDCMYMRWKVTENPESVYALWRNQGLPDFIFGTVPLQIVYSEDDLKNVTYYWIDTAYCGSIWKNQKEEGKINIYIRSDLLDVYPQFEIQTYAKKAKEPT